MPRRTKKVPLLRSGASLDELSLDRRRVEQAFGRTLPDVAWKQIAIVTMLYCSMCSALKNTAPAREVARQVEKLGRVVGDLECMLLDSIDRPAEVISADFDFERLHAIDKSFFEFDSYPPVYQDALYLRFTSVLGGVRELIALVKHDLAAIQLDDDWPWEPWIVWLTSIMREHSLPDGARQDDMGQVSPFVALVLSLQEQLPFHQHTHSPQALAKAINKVRRSRNCGQKFRDTFGPFLEGLE